MRELYATFYGEGRSIGQGCIHYASEGNESNRSRSGVFEMSNLRAACRCQILIIDAVTVETLLDVVDIPEDKRADFLLTRGAFEIRAKL